MATPIILVKDVKKYYPVHHSLKDYIIPQKFLRAVNGVNLAIYPGEILGLLGESSCGKSTLLRSIMAIEQLSSGYIEFDGQKINELTKKQFRTNCQLVVQNPYSTFNPAFTIGTSLNRAARFIEHNQGIKCDSIQKILEEVGISKELLFRYPNELSGGELQRLNIARALLSKPKFLALDEPTSSLDRSTKNHVIKMLRNLQLQRGLSILLVTHDFEVASKLAQKIAVMYAGQLVEIGLSNTLQRRPLHPYTKALISSVLNINFTNKQNFLQDNFLDGEPPNPMNLPQGCSFHPRCKRKQDICMKQMPEMKKLETDHFVACHYPLIKP